MKTGDKTIIPPHVMARAVGDETVILNLESGTYFGLDPVGARVWQLLSEQLSFAEIHETLLREYEVSGEVLEGDLANLIAALENNGLIGRL